MIPAVFKAVWISSSVSSPLFLILISSCSLALPMKLWRRNAGKPSPLGRVWRGHLTIPKTCRQLKIYVYSWNWKEQNLQNRRGHTHKLASFFTFSMSSTHVLVNLNFPFLFPPSLFLISSPSLSFVYLISPVAWRSWFPLYFLEELQQDFLCIKVQTEVSVIRVVGGDKVTLSNGNVSRSDS